MKTVKRGLACAVSLALLLCAVILPVNAAAPGYEDALPVVLIHGIFQSQVFFYDDDGNVIVDDNGRPIEAGLPDLDLTAIALPLLLPLVASFMLQSDIFLVRALQNAVRAALGPMGMDEYGRPLANTQVRRFVDENGKPMSLAELEAAGDTDGRNYILRTLPLEGVAATIGEDKVYYFAYDSLGNHGDITDELLQFIKDVSAKHGGSQVKIVPISLGGTFANSLIDYYYESDLRTTGPNGKPLLHSVIYVIPALDGSRIAGDVYLNELATGNKDLYHDMIPLLVEGYMGPLINIVLRLLPKRVVLKIFDGVVDTLMEEIGSYFTTLWSLVPSGDYERAREMWLMDDAHAEVRKQTDKYYQAQLNSRENVLKMQADGVHVYDIVEYNLLLYSIAGSYRSVNSDTLIHVDSASMGATSVMPGKSLPADYVPKDPSCTDPTHNHFDDSRTLDASTGILPEHTWYFKDSNHERTGRNDVILGLVTKLVITDEYISVHDDPNWPQFNYGRTPGDLKWMVEFAEAADASEFSATDKAELDAAIQEAKDVLAKTIVVPGEYEDAFGRLSAIMVKVGLRGAPETNWTETILDAVFCFLNDLLYYAYGPRGFSDFFWAIWRY